MQDYFEKYASLLEEISLACDCVDSNPCSNLASEVSTIKDTLNKLNIYDGNWADGVATTFQNIKRTFVTELNKIIESINSLFKQSETLYKTLKANLEDLKKQNDALKVKMTEKPDMSDYYRNVLTGKDENNKSVYKRQIDHREYNAAMDKWKTERDNLVTACENLVTEIEGNLSELESIDGNSLTISNISTTFDEPINKFTELIEESSTINNSFENKLDSISGNTIILPDGLGNIHTYMGWQKVTNKSSNQYKLRELANKNNDSSYDKEGFARIGDRYVVATTTTYGNVGDYIDIYQEDGTVIKAIIGDVKSQQVVAWDHNPANKWGHNNGHCVVEFVVDCNSWYNSTWKKGNHANPGTSNCHPEWNQNIEKIVNKGSYFDTIQV